MVKDRLSMGVDVGGTNIKFGVTDESGRVILRHKIRTATEAGSEGIIQSIIDGISVVLAQSGSRLSDLNSMGLGVPGTTDPENGVVIFAPNLFWKNVPIASRIREVHAIPVYLAQDSRAAVWAEYLVGAGKGHDSRTERETGKVPGMKPLIEDMHGEEPEKFCPVPSLAREQGNSFLTLTDTESD
jgi:glucokinase